MLGNVNKCVYMQVYKYIYMYVSVRIHALFTCVFPLKMYVLIHVYRTERVCEAIRMLHAI